MKNIFEKAWDIIRDPASNSQTALAIAVIVVVTQLGGVATLLYGFSARTCGFWCSVSGGLVAGISAAASYSAGGLLGLLFGAPSFAAGAGPRATAAGTQDGSTDTPSSSAIRPNTSLERIADWLTTMIVGLGLVNLSAIWEKAGEASVWLTREITANPSTLNGTPGIAIALSFGFAGFLLMYLWSLRFLPSELRQSYEIHQLATQISKINKALLNSRVPADALDKQIDGMRIAGVDAATLDDVRRLYVAATSAQDEPMKDFGPSLANGYTVSVALTEVGGGFWSFTATLSSPPEASGQMFWLLHNTFSPNVVSSCHLQKGGASFESTANEPFWIGVVVPQVNQPALRLAFDLSTAKGASDKFVKAP